MIRYTINLVRQLRSEEKKAVEMQNRVFTISVSCAALLALAWVLVIFQFLAMETKLRVEKQELARIQLEYSKYKSTRMVIDKADIERLDALQSDRIFWTKKLAAMAYYLPENYWITKFGFDSKVYKVVGYGNISEKQEQLITLDDYLNRLRADSTYKDIFKTTYFNQVQRVDNEKERNRVCFEYSSLK
jgi:hypothetical protein